MKLYATFLLIYAFLVFTNARAADAPPSRWLRYSAISPDGQSIAFCHSGQLWLVNANGGEATPLTSGEFYSTRPVWSPDSKTLAFASKRNGNIEVLLPSGGVVLYDRYGNVIQKGRTVSGSQLYDANKAVQSYIRENNSSRGYSGV
jgi:Tol biopolymer transport system component